MWKTVLRILLSVVAIFLVFREIDFHAFVGYLISIHVGLYFFAVIIQIISSLIAAYKWEKIMAFIGYDASFRFYGKSYLIGTMFNQILPTSVGGDAVRIAYAKKLGAGLKKAFYGVMTDRYYGTAGLVIINIVPMFWLDSLIPHHVFLAILGILSIVALALIAALLLCKIPFLNRFKYTQIIYELSQAIVNNARSAERIVQLLLLAVFSNLLTIISTYYIAQSLDLPVSLMSLLGVMPAVTLITLLPISFAGWGVREGAMVGFLLFLGLPKAAILSLSVLYGIMLILASLPGLYFYVFRRDKV